VVASGCDGVSPATEGDSQHVDDSQLPCADESYSARVVDDATGFVPPQPKPTAPCSDAPGAVRDVTHLETPSPPNVVESRDENVPFSDPEPDAKPLSCEENSVSDDPSSAVVMSDGPEADTTKTSSHSANDLPPGATTSLDVKLKAKLSSLLDCGISGAGSKSAAAQVSKVPASRENSYSMAVDSGAPGFLPNEARVSAMGRLPADAMTSSGTEAGSKSPGSAVGEEPSADSTSRDLESRTTSVVSTGHPSPGRYIRKSGAGGLRTTPQADRKLYRRGNPAYVARSDSVDGLVNETVAKVFPLSSVETVKAAGTSFNCLCCSERRHETFLFQFALN